VDTKPISIQWYLAAGNVSRFDRKPENDKKIMEKGKIVGKYAFFSLNFTDNT